ncbi:MAG: hypothetical protein AAF616_10190 [Bacteroidota bacterium]
MKRIYTYMPLNATSHLQLQKLTGFNGGNVSLVEENGGGGAQLGDMKAL